MKMLFLLYLLIFSISNIFAYDFQNFSVQNNKINNSIIPINPFEGENNLYQQIFDQLNVEYDRIGRLEAERVLNNRLTVTGGLNNIGISIKRPFIDFGISLDRNLAPDLFDDKRWIVTDTLSIHIDAHKVMSRLKSEGKIDITEKNLAAFIGLVFMRKFSWVHFANSYEDGLMRDFHKLFFPFLGLKKENLLKLNENEMILKEDFISVNAGGYVSAPLYQGVSFQGGVLAKFQKISKTEINSRQNGKELMLLISIEKSKIIEAGMSLSIQADFFHILKMTLLSYDLSYALEKSYKIYADFPKTDLSERTFDDPIWEEIIRMSKGVEPNKIVILPFLVSEEKRLSENLKQKYNFLFFGGIKSAKTQFIELTMGTVSKTFFRHYYEKIKYTEDLLSRFFASLIYAITNTDAKAMNMAQDTRKVTIEYDDAKNLIDSYEDLDITKNVDSQKLSLSFTGDYSTKKIDGFLGKKYKDRALFLLEKYSGVDPLVFDLVNQNQLKAPFNIKGIYNINTKGVRYFNSLNLGLVYDQFEKVCEDKPKKTFINFLSLFDNCKKSLQNDYLDYVKDLTHEKVSAQLIEACESKASKYIFRPSKKRAFLKSCLETISKKSEAEWVEIPLFRLKNLAQNLGNNTNSKIYFYNLFGLENVFFHGTFEASYQNGAQFVSYFHEGKFNGLGVVDHFMRENMLRTPASIVIDQ